MVILVLGGTGRLYGGLVGAIVFMVARDQFSGIEPQYWYFWIGLLLVAVVMFLPNGILGGLAQADVALEPVVSAPALATRGLAKSFGSLVVASDIEIELAERRSLRADRPNGAGKTTLINLMTGMLRPDAGHILLDDADITALPPEQRVRRGLVRTYQINSLFPHLTALESVTLAVCERSRAAGIWWRQLDAYQPRDRRGLRHPLRAEASIRFASGRRANWPTASSACSKSRWRWRPGRRCCCSTSRRPACRARRAGIVRRHRRPVARDHRAVHRARHGTGLSLRHARDRAGRRPGAAEGTPHEIASDPRVRAVYLGKAIANVRADRAMSRMTMLTDPLLAFDNVRAGYGSAVVLDGISFSLPERGSLALLGRNGVGKSTLILTIMGYTRVGRGRVLWRGDDITQLPSHRRALGGIGWVAQEREIFSSLTVEENLTVAARAGAGTWPPCTSSFRGLQSAGAISAISFPAASNRCWRLPAR